MIIDILKIIHIFSLAYWICPRHQSMLLTTTWFLDRYLALVIYISTIVILIYLEGI